MDYFLRNWGSFTSLTGLLVTIVMVGIAIWRAGQAEESATAARTAAQETQQAIAGVLTIVDLERAIAMVERLKQLHRDRKLEVCLELYQLLRVMLTNINPRSTIDTPEIQEAIPQIWVIENSVAQALAEGLEPTAVPNFYGVLNRIQMSMEQIASTLHMPGSEAG